MDWKKLDIPLSYSTRESSITRDFFNPLLEEAVLYQRAVGFFSSSALLEILDGIKGLVKNDGKIQFIASPRLAQEDVDALTQGYQEREDIILQSLERTFHIDLDLWQQKRMNLLTNLIAQGYLDLRIVLLEENNDFGMYHEKMGIVTDTEGNQVAFSGSMNESRTAFCINYERIDIFCSWKQDAARVEQKVEEFRRIWNNEDSNLRTYEFPKVNKTLIERYKISDLDFTQLDEVEEFMPPPVNNGAEIPSFVKLYDYQEMAIQNWAKADFCGIFDMATGTGKTLTGLGATAYLSNFLSGKLAVYIVCPYQHLVEQWVEDIEAFGMKPIIAYSSSSQKDWRKRLTKAVTDQKIRNDKSFYCCVCTNATFSSRYVQEQIDKTKAPILLLVDEAHNFGSGSLSKLLDQRFQYRLALSATLERHRDEDGTATLHQFFGEKCIEYSLERAIEENKLTPYKYYPIVVYLDDDELEEYENLTYEMGKCLIRGANGTCKLNKYGEMLALKRARLVAGASEKLRALRESIKPYTKDNNILVYCGATNVLDSGAEQSSTDSSDIRQIEAVTKILGNEYQMDVAKFTAEENMEERATIKEQFLKGDGLQAIIAIKCLDEGVNIPAIKTAFILASTTNPKEYIQRRGRVLRKSPGKDFAEIYDFITLTRPLDEVSSLTVEQAQRDKSLIKNELARLYEFCRLAMNPMDGQSLIWNMMDAYQIKEENLTEREHNYE